MEGQVKQKNYCQFRPVLVLVDAVSTSSQVDLFIWVGML